jgi:hypothetical protein
VSEQRPEPEDFGGENAEEQPTEQTEAARANGLTSNAYFEVAGDLGTRPVPGLPLIGTCGLCGAKLLSGIAHFCPEAKTHAGGAG